MPGRDARSEAMGHCGIPHRRRDRSSASSAYHSRPMSIIDEYVARTPRSAALFERAARSLPGGSTRTTVFAPPYPPYISRGDGIWIEDVDGNRYRDFLLNYTVLILGHAHPAVVAAVEREAPHGSPFGAPTEAEVELAEELVRRL